MLVQPQQARNLASCNRVRNQFMKMRDETNHKNRNEVYFEVRLGVRRR